MTDQEVAFLNYCTSLLNIINVYTGLSYIDDVVITLETLTFKTQLRDNFLFDAIPISDQYKHDHILNAPNCLYTVSRQ